MKKIIALFMLVGMSAMTSCSLSETDDITPDETLQINIDNKSDVEGEDDHCKGDCSN